MHIDSKMSVPALPRGNLPSLNGKHASPIPAMPHDVAAAVKEGIVERRMLFPDNAPTRTVERWEVPKISPQMEDAILGYLAALEETMTPADEGSLLARILALLSHFRSDPNPPQVEALIAMDWADDLGKYPMWAIDAAARRWRRTKRFRPQVNEIVDLCEDEVGDSSRTLFRLRKMAETMGRTEAQFSKANRFSEIARELSKDMRRSGS